MNYGLIVIGLILYVLIAVFIHGVLCGIGIDSGGRWLCSVFWPLTLIMLLICSVIETVHDLGEACFMNKED